MAEISVIFEGPDDPAVLSRTLDVVARALDPIDGVYAGLLGLTVDGQPREPDEPGEPVF